VIKDELSEGVMFIPTLEVNIEMSPIEFEKYAIEILKAQIKGLENIKVIHNKIIEVEDGNYQIDGYIEFEIMGVKYKTIIECKHYKTSITREKVQVLYEKIRACGVNKGILISTSNFQSGAIKFASIHGIALIQLTESGPEYQTRSRLNVIMNSPRTPYVEGAKYIGVMQTNFGSGITCSYLTDTNLSLGEFLRMN